MALFAIVAIEAAYRHAGNRMHGLARKTRLLQSMLYYGPIQPRPRVTIEMRWCPVDGTNGIHGTFRLILEYALLSAVYPGHVRTANPCTRRNNDQATIRQCQFGECVAVIEADRDWDYGGGVGH